jgi:hypothetical protein
MPWPTCSAPTSEASVRKDVILLRRTRSASWHGGASGHPSRAAQARGRLRMTLRSVVSIWHVRLEGPETNTRRHPEVLARLRASLEGRRRRAGWHDGANGHPSRAAAQSARPPRDDGIGAEIVGRRRGDHSPFRRYLPNSPAARPAARRKASRFCGHLRDGETLGRQASSAKPRTTERGDPDARPRCSPASSRGTWRGAEPLPYSACDP